MSGARSMHMNTFRAVLCTAGLLVCAIAQAAGAYKITILRPIAGKTVSAAQFGLNAGGLSVGTSGGTGARRATLWNRQGNGVALAQPRAAIFSRAMGINDCGLIVGAVDTTGQSDLTGLRAVRWRSPNRYEFILTDNGYDSDALGINERGWIVGIRFTGAVFNPFVASPSGRVNYPMPLAEGDSFELLSVNRRHEAAGFDSGDSGTFAVRWTESRGVESLGLLAGGTISAAASINDHGEIGGVADDANGEFRAVRWNSQGDIEQLESLENAIYSDAQLGINNRGFSVGVTIFDGSDPDDFLSQRATLWDPQGEAFNLNDLIPPKSGIVLITANAINDAGEIYGDAVSAKGERFAYLLVPDPRRR